MGLEKLNYLRLSWRSLFKETNFKGRMQTEVSALLSASTPNVSIKVFVKVLFLLLFLPVILILRENTHYFRCLPKKGPCQLDVK